ncbi:UNVERIFIED_CONTAM: transcriptional regulator with XRE-family HTH domain [Streptomyces canus]
MNDEDPNRNRALTELRRRLEAARTRMRLNKTDLAGRAGLGRTTVSEAFQIGGPAPSVQTVTALAGALRLPVEELQELQRAAAGGGTSEAPRLGRPIGQWDPHTLEVHPAGIAQDGSGSPRQQILPGYVVREHDRLLASTTGS